MFDYLQNKMKQKPWLPTNLLNSPIDLSRSNQSATITFQINLSGLQMSSRWLEENNQAPVGKNKPVTREGRDLLDAVHLSWATQQREESCWWREKYGQRTMSFPDLPCRLVLRRTRAQSQPGRGTAWDRHEGLGYQPECLWSTPEPRTLDRLCHQGNKPHMHSIGTPRASTLFKNCPFQAPAAALPWRLSTGQGVEGLW